MGGWHDLPLPTACPTGDLASRLCGNDEALDYPTSSAAEAPAIFPKTEPCMRPAPPA